MTQSAAQDTPHVRAPQARVRKPPSVLERFQNNRNALGWAFMLPATVLLVLFLTYPLGLGTWLGFTDAKIGRDGQYIGLENFSFLVGDSVTQLALFNTLFYTVVASIAKFGLGVGSSRVDLQACKLEYSIVSPK